MEFKTLIIGILLSAIIIFALIQGTNQITIENNASNPLLNSSNSAINNTINSIESELSQAQNKSQDVRTAVESEKSSFASGFLLFGSILDAGKTFISMFVAIINLVLESISQSLGISTLVTGVFISIFIIIAVTSAWRFWKAGE